MHESDEWAERDFSVSMLTRVEGEGSLILRVRHGEVEEAQLSIFEAPRYFEKIVEGRSPNDVIDIVARICGICPVAYQMSAVHAFEDGFGVEISPEVRALRRLMYCGEWIESHGLHVFMLHAPDFLGYPSAIEMAKDYNELVTRGLQIKRFGNDIVGTLGGRAIHPVSLRVGGFSHVPKRRDLDELRHMADHTIEWTQDALGQIATFDAPEFEREVVYVSLRDPVEYPMNHGRIVSTDGIDVAENDWRSAFEEFQVERTNALHSRTLDGKTYFVGPAARVSLCSDTLHPVAAAALAESGLADAIRVNPYWSIAARAVEILHAACEAAEIIDGYTAPDAPSVPVEPREGVVAWATEAPRGLLFHRYGTDAHGNVTHAQIVPPTSQNQGRIEDDLREFAPGVLLLSDDEIQHQLEQLVRSYDPCISCSTHFLDVTIEDIGEDGGGETPAVAVKDDK